MRRLLEPDESLRLGAGALASWETAYSPARGLESLVEAYQHAIRLRHRPQGTLHTARTGSVAAS